MDISIVIQREQKKLRKVEKLIKRQTAKGRILKPIDEIEGDRAVLKTLRQVNCVDFSNNVRLRLPYWVFNLLFNTFFSLYCPVSRSLHLPY